MKWILGWLSRCLMRWGKVVGVDCYTISIEDYDRREARGRIGITPITEDKHHAKQQDGTDN